MTHSRIFRKRSRYLDTTVDIDADELRIRLTEAGEEIAVPDTGGVQAAGGSAHDEALFQIETRAHCTASRSRSSHKMAARNLTRGRATPTLTTDSLSKSKRRPQRIPQRYSRTSGKPKRQGTTRCLSFDQETTKLSGLSVSTAFSRHPFALSRMVRRGSTQPTQTLTFNGGATEEGGVTAVRPASDDDGTQNIWWRDGDEIALRDASGMEHIRLPSLGKLSKDRVPAIYSYDHAADEYAVFEHGEQHIYETKSAFEDDWVRIKKPFVPEAELQTPHYSSTSYAIVILPEEGDPVVYDTDGTYSMDTLLDTVTTSECEETTGEQAGHIQQTPQPSIDDIADDPEAVVERFAEIHLVEDPQSRVTAGDVYEIYEQWAEAHEIDTDSKPWFGRRLGNYVSFERKTDNENGDSVRYYKGLSLRSEENRR